jgi:carnitine 3-dehydrogenase
MNESRYLQVFCDGSDALLRYIGADTDYVATGRSYYTAETHIMHLGECKVGTPLTVETQVLSSDEKRLHVLHSIVNTDTDSVVATAEQMFLHVDMKAQKACPADAKVLAKLRPIAEAHAKLPKPDSVGRYVGAPRKK